MKPEIFLPFIDLGIKFFLYILAGKIRKITIPLVTCAAAAGVSILVGMFQMPELLSFAFAIGLAAFLIVRNSDVEIYPDGIMIPFAVEIVAAFLLTFGIAPLLNSIG